MPIRIDELYKLHIARALYDKKPILFPIQVALLAKRNGDARDALEDAGLFPHWEQVYETHAGAIEAAYSTSPDALLLIADPLDLLLLPIAVVGGIDTSEADALVNYPRNKRDLPPLLPPRQSTLAPLWRIDPALDRTRTITRFHPNHTAATQALRRLTFERWPDLTTRELAAAPTVIFWLPQAHDEEDARRWFEAVRAYDAPRILEYGLDEIIARNEPEIVERMKGGPLGVVFLRLRGENHVLIARPDPVANDRASVLVGYGPDRTIEDLLVEARANHPVKGTLVYAILLHHNDPNLNDKLELIRTRVPDAEVLSLFSDRGVRTRHKGSVLFFEIETSKGRRERFVTKILMPVKPRPPQEEVLFPRPLA